VLLLLRLGRGARLRRAEPAPPPPPREKKKTVLARGQAGYDLARDDSTDSQRWLM
jgi:hypothetical protein